MNTTSRHRILVVDDEPGVRESMAMLLVAEGYEVKTAQHGLDALLQLRKPPLPKVIVSALAMPQMSGFEFLSVVRRRFPEILVLAISSAYDFGCCVPGSVIADAFYSKGSNHPEDLSRLVGELIQTTAVPTIHRRNQSAPVWIPQSGKDSNGIPFIVLTCGECLRSFPLSVQYVDALAIKEMRCQFCATPLRYIIDFSPTISSRAHEITVEENHKQA